MSAVDWAKGPLPKQLGGFPLKFAKAAVIVDLSPGGPRFSNGTATLLELGGKKIAITCFHVIQWYRRLWRDDRESIFQIGNLKLEPTYQVIEEDSDLDLATIELSDQQANDLEKDGAQFFAPVCWPPAPVDSSSDWLAIGGFPGSMREHIGGNVLDVVGYSVGATPVSSVSEKKIVCRFERDRWIWSHNPRDLPDASNLGGMSGGPGFVLRRLHWEFAGIIFQFSEGLDAMLLRPATLIREDGSLCTH